MTSCGQCGARIVAPPMAVEDQRVDCTQCGMPTMFRGVLANAAIARRARKPPPISHAGIEELVRGNICLAHALDNVRPTKELLEHCYEALRKHGIAWHR